ncbi:MAG: hypothetical protein KDJ52_18765 [Anaerolineae bacterium]|nr:hypothetical protein [Anaerolineae bacterium]
MTPRLPILANSAISNIGFYLNQKFFVIGLIVFIGLTYNSSGNILAAQTQQFPQVFILMNDTSNPEQFSQLQAFIKERAGRVTHIFPHRALMAKVPYDTMAQLKSFPGVGELFTNAVDVAQIGHYSAETQQLISTWNAIVAPVDPNSVMNKSVGTHFGEEEHTFIAPDFPQEGEKGIGAASSVTPGYYETSEYLTGSVAVGIVLVESNGTTDPSTENWVNDEKQLVFNEIVSAMNWWAELEPRANLSFVYDDHFTNPLPTSVEPITRPYSDQKYWIEDAMTALGYSSSSYFTQVRDYNNDLRSTYKTDWAFTIFVVDSSQDSDNRFSDGYFAYAYLGGPFMVMTYGNNGYGPYYMDAVAAHEMGHIFHALDQYSGAGQACDRRSGYLDIENQNSQYGSCLSNTSSIMRGQISPFNAKLIDMYAAGQIGWKDSDNDNIFDPMDTNLPISIDTFSQTGNTITVTGNANVVPYPSPSHTSVTINHLTGVKYRFGNDSWKTASAADGNFNSTAEGYHFSATINIPGQHLLQVAATDSAGNISNDYATQSINILDPVDGGLNTELYTLSEVAITKLSQIYGKAYHMEGKKVVKVEYRINGGTWQPAIPSDGIFDSSYEDFNIDPNAAEIEPGTYIVEARATDDQGHVEVNSASREVQINESNRTFIPFVISR